MAMVRPVAVQLGARFRADAKAEGQDVAIGGWETVAGRGSRQSRWYSVRLNRKNAPWPFCRGEPSRTIASLELFAMLISVISSGREWRGSKEGTIPLTA